MVGGKRWGQEVESVALMNFMHLGNTIKILWRSIRG